MSPEKKPKLEETNTENPPQYDGTSLKTLLDNVDPVGSFATQGNFKPPTLSPKITVEGFGIVGLPLHPLLAAGLKEVASKAPFGRGPATLLDESVRKAWQIEPNQVSVDGDGWGETLHKLVKDSCYELGISNENVDRLGIKANLYKVLLYEEGGHFKAHKDTEKEEGMFGTLVVQLPSIFSGGSSNINNQGETRTFDLAKDCETAFNYVAFYADCEHEILPVTGGWRFCLVYNLVVTKPNNEGVVPHPDQMMATIRDLQLEVVKLRMTNTGKIGYALDHKYSLDNFGFGKLKGRDAVVSSVLRNAKDQTSDGRLFDLSLVIFSYKFQNSYETEHEFGVEKVILEDGTEDLSSPVWVKNVMYRGDDGLMWDFDDMPEEKQTEIKKYEENWEHEKIDIGNQHEAWVDHHDAGNEGGGRTTWYRSACIVMSPTHGLVPAVVSLCGKGSEKKT